MARKRSYDDCPIKLLTDEEFDRLSIKNNKSSFLDNLRDASSTTGFSSRKIREQKERNNKQPDINLHSESKSVKGLAASIMDLPERVEYVDDDRWEFMLTQFDEISPIEDITDEERSYYRNKTDGDKFDQMFKKEHSMLNDVLSDIQKRSKIINSRINSMGGKGSYGISKSFVELVEAGTAMDTAKLQIIKAMADLKKTSTDLRMKDQKNNPDTGVTETKDSVADRFYKSIISGGSRKFIESSIDSYHNTAYDAVNNPTQFNISQPINSNQTTTDITVDDVDSFGYIRNESKNVDICLHRYPDGSIEFVALDEGGNIVYDYELPDNDVLETVEIKPMARYGYDVYQRKYRVVDVDDSMNFNNSNIDKMTSDDKYDY